MNQSPKLLQAMDQINEILDDMNLAAIVVIHTPGFVLPFVKIDPAYSCCSVKKGAYKIDADRYKDFGGDVGKMTERMTDTLDMLNLLVTNAAMAIIPLGELTRTLNRATDAENPATNN